MVFPTFFNLILNFAIRSSWSEPQSAPGLVFAECIERLHFGCNLKNDRKISICFQGKPFNITVIQVYAPTTDSEEAEVDQFYEDLEDLWRSPRTNTKKRCSIHHWGLECKSRKSRDTLNNRWVGSWSTKWSRAKANKVFIKRTCWL